MWRIVKSYLLYTWGGLHRYFGNMNNIPHEHRRAAHYFTRAYQTNPRLRQARLARAVILYREMDRIEEAIADFDALLQEDADYGPALLNRAMAHQQAGHYRMALRDLQVYLQLPQIDEYRDLALRMSRLLQELVDGEAGQ